MKTAKQLNDYLERMDGLGFHHREKYGEIFTEVHTLHETPAFKKLRKYLALIRDWLVVPYSFWPSDFPGLASYICRELKAGRPLSPRLLFTLDLLRRFPAAVAQEMVAANEHNVQVGEYKQFVRSNAKYEAYERRIMNNQLLKMQWEKIKALFPVHLYVDKRGKGIVRRRMVCERNFKTIDWPYVPDSELAAFQAAFDAFCYEWSLYGMEGDKPLLLKITVNVTPYGTLIMIPFYMSPDFRRDINTKIISKIHKSNGATRQGDKRFAAQLEREDDARRAFQASELWLTVAEQERARGTKQHDYIREQALLPKGMNDRQVLRLMKEGKRLVQESPADVFGAASIQCEIQTSPPRPDSLQRIEHARTAIAALSPEEKREVMKLLAV